MNGGLIPFFSEILCSENPVEKPQIIPDLLCNPDFRAPMTAFQERYRNFDNLFLPYKKLGDDLCVDLEIVARYIHLIEDFLPVKPEDGANTGYVAPQQQPVEKVDRSAHE